MDNNSKNLFYIHRVVITEKSFNLMRLLYVINLRYGKGETVIKWNRKEITFFNRYHITTSSLHSEVLFNEPINMHRWLNTIENVPYFEQKLRNPKVHSKKIIILIVILLCCYSQQSELVPCVVTVVPEIASMK